MTGHDAQCKRYREALERIAAHTVGVDASFSPNIARTALEDKRTPVSDTEEDWVDRPPAVRMIWRPYGA